MTLPCLQVFSLHRPRGLVCNFVSVLEGQVLDVLEGGLWGLCVVWCSGVTLAVDMSLQAVFFCGFVLLRPLCYRGHKLRRYWWTRRVADEARGFPCFAPSSQVVW